MIESIYVSMLEAGMAGADRGRGRSAGRGRAGSAGGRRGCDVRGRAATPSAIASCSSAMGGRWSGSRRCWLFVLRTKAAGFAKAAAPAGPGRGQRHRQPGLGRSTITAIASVCAPACARRQRGRSPTTSCSNCCCSSDPPPGHQADREGDAAELGGLGAVLAAEPAALRRVPGTGCPKMPGRTARTRDDDLRSPRCC